MTNDQESPAATRLFISSSGGIFNGFFKHSKSRSCDKHNLVDGRARRIFDLMAAACEAGVYPYQMALQTRTGPRVEAEGRDLLLFSSNDYLGLVGHPRIDAAAIDAIRKYGTGTGGSRMLTGTIDLHHEMEYELAAFKGTAEAITFTSGYMANLAVISALLTPQDRVILDALAHRSLVDACRLAGVPLQRFAHNDMGALRHELETPSNANRTVIIADGVFSMDGDICHLPELVALKKEFGCYLMIDDAHATGVLGATGRGTDEHFGIASGEVDIWTGTLAKAIPASGGFAAVSQEVSIYLQHAGAPFIFSTALCPSAVAVVREALAIIHEEPERVARLRSNAKFLRDGLRDLGYDVGASETAIIPVILREEAKTALFAGALRDRGLMVTAVTFPAVPMGSARLRVCMTAGHTQDNLEYALDVFKQLRP
jgi:8-amino-7-oxononanoate synthase